MDQLQVLLSLMVRYGMLVFVAVLRCEAARARCQAGTVSGHRRSRTAEKGMHCASRAFFPQTE